MTITLRGTKGSALTHNELDGNFTDLNTRTTTLEGGGSGVALTDLSVTSATAGTAALAYDNATGVFTYTPPDLSSYLTTVAFADVTNKPTTLAGYGITDGGGGGSQSRVIRTNQTSSLVDGAEADLDITGFKSYALLSITTDRAARVRLYVNAATRTADVSRAEGVDPTSDAGLIAEVITAGTGAVIISPGALGFNLENFTTSNIPCRVTNKSGSTSTVQVSLNILQLEA